MTIIEGDILATNTSKKYVLVCHQVNCKGVMGSGLAKQIRTKFPKLFDNYCAKCSKAESSVALLGDVQFYDALFESGYFVANVFGQDSYGRDRRYTDYTALKRAFESIAYAVNLGGEEWTVRIPYLFGCGLGGGDWTIVSQIIEETLIDNGVEVEIWKLPNKS